MAIYRNISQVVPGDTFRLLRSLGTLPYDSELAHAYLTVKKDPQDSDVRSVIKKDITLTNAAGVGLITKEDNGSYDIYFELTGLDTNLLDASSTYYYDLQIETEDGNVYTVEFGKMFTSYNINKAK